MNKKEFQERIDKAERLLMRKRPDRWDTPRYRGVCGALARSFEKDDSRYDACDLDSDIDWKQRAVNDFNEYFQQRSGELCDSFRPTPWSSPWSSSWWLGSCTGPEGKENRAKRVIYLRMFEQWAITYKAYRMYRSKV